MRILVAEDERRLIRELETAIKNFSSRIDIVLVPPGSRGQSLPGTHRQRFLIRQGQRLQSLDVRDIHYFFAEDRFVFCRTKDNKKYLIDYRIEELEQMLDPALFFRVNRSLLISIFSIDTVYSYAGNRLRLHVLPAYRKEIVVSRERVPAFRKWMGE
ncbi:MAG TPA: LytTR family DNA-binding domain-containing protein [Puia sp.]|uniref:LytR/AlgR family response regulator transcription factor n=1 Tax=Puia sp. TaxID=2045100 RepID=UPI002BE1D150|nr:LytTR family DNA-binding domain-containing protein [Puia sp.]HVU96525.1 LytTR family DNA-binding domain-containing protein [Puia sp.]